MSICTLQATELLLGQPHHDLSLQVRHVGHLHELLVLVLGVDRLELGVVSPGEHLGQLADHRQDLLGGVAGVVGQGGGPGGGEGGVGLQQPQTEEQRPGSHEGGRDVSHVVLQQRDLDEVLGNGVLEHVNISSLGVASEEVERERSGEVEAERAEHAQLHLSYVGRGVGIVSDVDEVVDLRSVHLLDLAGNEHGGDTDQLELVPSDGEALELRRNKM